MRRHLIRLLFELEYIVWKVPTVWARWRSQSCSRWTVASSLLVALGLTMFGFGSEPVAASSDTQPGSGRGGDLTAVSATSANDVWAVGSYNDPADTDATLTKVLHWDGTGWTKFASPDPGGLERGDSSALESVSADSASDAWAVGNYARQAQATETLLLHWDGTSWTKVASPNPGGTASSDDSTVLYGVSAVSPSDAWAVGYYSNPTTRATETLLLHWNGTAWTQVASPNPGGTTSPQDFSGLLGVNADASSDAWAFGNYGSRTLAETFVLHWNGAAWDAVPIPSPGGASPGDLTEPTAVGAVTPSQGWVVGYYANPTTLARQTMSIRWNGGTWTDVATPDPGDTTSSGDSSVLLGISADSSSDAWAVGYYRDPISATDRTLALHWDGTEWSQVPSPSVGPTRQGNFLNGVSVVSPTDAWAVGFHAGSGPGETLVLHWNGRTWSKA